MAAANVKVCRCSERVSEIRQDSNEHFKIIRKGLKETRSLVELEQLYRHPNEDNPFPLTFFCRSHDIWEQQGPAMFGPCNLEIRGRKRMKEATAEYDFFIAGYDYVLATGMFTQGLQQIRDEFQSVGNIGNGYLSSTQITKYFGVEIQWQETSILHYLKAVDVFLYLLVKYSYPNISPTNIEIQRTTLSDILDFAKLVVTKRKRLRKRDEAHEMVLKKWMDVVSVLQAVLDIQDKMHTHTNYFETTFQ